MELEFKEHEFPLKRDLNAAIGFGLIKLGKKKNCMELEFHLKRHYRSP